MVETERKLATIRIISAVESIEGADKICAYRIDGWWVVDQVGKYKVGDLVIYVEIDSWLSHELAPFLSKGKEPREYEGIKGERLRTIRLKGQVSQGLILPVEIDNGQFSGLVYVVKGTAVEEGDDVTTLLGIVKWERPINAQLAGLIRGNFPSEIPKTNQERIQNLSKEFEELQKHQWVVTEKLDGTSVTFYLDKEGDFHVCSRNLDLKRDENNLYWKIAIDLDIERKMLDYGYAGCALQGEIIGEGIQGNQYKRRPVFHLFDMYDSIRAVYFPVDELELQAEVLGVKTVPVLSVSFPLVAMDIPFLLTWAEGKSMLNDSQREGVVFQCLGKPEKSFKVVSNAWLLKNE